MARPVQPGYKPVLLKYVVSREPIHWTFPYHSRVRPRRLPKKALLNSGATENFIDPRMVEKLGLGSIDLQEPRTVFNVDGTENQDGKTTSYCLLNILKGRKEAAQIFYITNLGEDRIILGYPWLWEFDPQINWKEGKVRGPPIKLSTTGRSWKLKWAA
jgi:hypothetical protein